MIIGKSIYKSLFTVILFAALLLGLSSSQAAMAQSTTDSVFLANSSTVIFKVNKTEITPGDKEWLLKNVVPTLRDLRPNSIIVGRSAASPEGPYENNRRLANGRRETIKALLEQEGINTSRIRFDMAVEEYALLLELMRQHHDKDYHYVKSVVDNLEGNDASIKNVLMKAQGGKLFKRLKDEYFAELRAVRIMVVVVKDDEVEIVDVRPMREIGQFRGVSTLPPFEVPAPGHIDVVLPRIDTVIPPPEDLPRREILSVKTNLLEYGAYVPKYGYCPMPNVAIEYYPKRGHVTWGLSLDFPWWIGNTTNHKYFELRNYVLEGRYYMRNSRKSYADGESQPNGKAAFKGFYLSAYGNLFLYQIGCNKDDGWIGEGVGAGLGLGYVIPLGKKNQRWRLDIGAQFGVFRTKYDPFVYGCPVEHVEDGLYYYDYTGDADLFKKRQYRFNWLGPTRVGITLSYDLFYRRIAKKGVSFKRWEKKGGKK